MRFGRVRGAARAPWGAVCRARPVAGRVVRLSPLLALAGCLLESGAFPGGGEVGPIEADTVACDCTFAESGSRTLRVQASTDDAEQVGTTMELQSLDLDLGDEQVGVRFDAIGLPPGAVIQSAYVQFTADESQGETTEVSIRAQLAVDAPSFSSDDNDITSRAPVTPSVEWSIDPWSAGDAGVAQRTPDLSALLQELVDLDGWTSESPVVLLLYAGGGLRSAESFDADPGSAAELVVTYGTALSTTIETCAGGDVERDADGYLVDPQATCDTLADTFGGLNAACGLPQSVTCTVVDQKDPNGDDVPDSWPDEVCAEGCEPNAVDAPECTEYDPVGLVACLNAGNGLSTCKPLHAAATHAGDDTPVCVASGSPLAFDAIGRRSRCEVAGSVELAVGDFAPRPDPVAAGGLVKLLGDPCPGEDCYVHPAFVLGMEPVSFAEIWGGDAFVDLGAAGAARDAARLVGGTARFATDTVDGTGRGHRGEDGLQIVASNPDVVVFGVDWAERLCTMTGALAVGVRDDGVCAGDTAIACLSDADCAGAGPCRLPQDEEELAAELTLSGELVNQPPTADAGADRTVECTSPAGAAFVLDGRGSRDPDGDLALASWRLGDRTGREISDDLRATWALGVGAQETYVLRVLDTYAQLDEDATNVSVVDTTPPTVGCGAPETVRPRDGAVTFTATVADTCDTSVSTTITEFDCWTINGAGRRISRLGACRVAVDDGAFTVVRTGGVDTHIGWTVEATDDAGNVGRASCEVVVGN